MTGVATDGIPDDPQVQYFGTNNANASPLRDPDGDGQSNLFEFTAGVMPTRRLSRFSLSVAPIPGQPLQENITFSPRLPDRTYTLEFSLNLTSWNPLTGATISDRGARKTQSMASWRHNVRIVITEIGLDVNPAQWLVWLAKQIAHLDSVAEGIVPKNARGISKPALPSEARIWTSNQGKTIQGRVIAVDLTRRTFTLERADATKFPGMSPAAFSESDQQFLKSLFDEK